MKWLKVLLIISIMIILMACSLTVNVPSVRTGITQTLDINEPLPSSGATSRIDITMGAGVLNIAGGSTKLVEGSIKYNVDAWKPAVTRDADKITFSQKNNSEVGVPDGKIVNAWDLKLGSTPIDLRLTSGAYQGTLDLSGLAITNLQLVDGASKVTVKFNSLNPAEMQLLSYKTGASDVELLGLGNANVQEITFDGGVGSFTLDFSGDLKKDINVRINSGMSDLKIIIPKTAHALVTSSGGLSNIDASGTWTIAGNTHECGSSGPVINISISMAVGNLQLIQQ
jgi:hypothetical protein